MTTSNQPNQDQTTLRNTYSKDIPSPSHLHSKLNSEKEDTHADHFRLKMAIFNGDHNFIMGRNNNNINRIMNDTQTLIQFPDPNLVKKGNQVTILGALGDMGKARISIRLSSPILISFELLSNQRIPSPEKIGNYFKVQVMFSSSPKPNTLLASIRGSHRSIDRLKKAARSLLRYAPEKMGNCTIISVQLEVPPQYHESVKGENCENIIKIMNHTNTKIFFPDLSIRGCRRSQVTITGSMDEVLLARSELVGYFPIELTFDIPPENGKATEIMELGRKSGVCITISHKERESGMSVTIKGAEKSIDKIFEVHRSIRQIKSFPYQQHVDSVVDNYVENLIEKSETTSDDCVSEQSPVMHSPDFGGHTNQDEIQQNNWMVYEPTCNQNKLVPESFGPIDHHGQYYSLNYPAFNITVQPNVQQTTESNEGWVTSYTPAASTLNAYSQQQHANFINYPQLFYPSKPRHHKNNWTICELQAPENIDSQSVQQLQTYNVEFKQHSQSVEDLQNQGLNFEICNSEHDVNSSPLIIGSDETVAGKLICSGWGKLL